MPMGISNGALLHSEFKSNCWNDESMRETVNRVQYHFYSVHDTGNLLVIMGKQQHKENENKCKHFITFKNL